MLTLILRSSVLAMILLLGCGQVDYYEDLGYNCLFYGGDGDGIYLPANYGKSIFGEVVQYKFDKHFITAIQSPDSIDHIRQIAFLLSSDNKRYNEKNRDSFKRAEQAADSIITIDNYYKEIFSSKINYWIVNHKKKEIVGPMNRKKFIDKFKKLKISDNLMFDNI